MRVLNKYEQTNVSGGNTAIYLAFLPVVGVTVKGLGLCLETGINYTSVLPMIVLTASTSFIGAAVSYFDTGNWASGSCLGGCLGMLAGMALEWDNIG